MKTNRGQTLVEFALCLPLLALLLFAIIQYGFIFYTYISLKNASAVGARYARLSPNPSIAEIQSATIDAARRSGLITNSIVMPTGYVDTNVTVTGISTKATSVKVGYNLPLIIPFVVPGKTAGGSLTLSGTTVMW
jgi:Flp pilus assembly protein TadG